MGGLNDNRQFNNILESTVYSQEDTGGKKRYLKLRHTNLDFKLCRMKVAI